MSPGDEAAAAPTYVVTVANNLVVAIARDPMDDGVGVPDTTLEIGTELAENFRRNGCLDGRYRFRNPQRARLFATLCLEFTRALIDRRLAIVKALKSDEAYCADEAPPRS